MQNPQAAIVLDAKFDELNKQFSRNVRKYFIRRGMSIDVLAAKSGISRSQIYHMLSSLMNPSLKMILKLSLALEVSIEELLNDEKTT